MKNKESRITNHESRISRFLKSAFFFLYSKFSIQDSKRGFTLLELVVTITIFVLLTTAILVRNSRFKDDLLITNLAYEVALSIREAQIYGINVEACENCGGGAYTHAYGIHFSLSDPLVLEDESTVSPEKGFQIFVDQDDNKVFSPGDDSLNDVVQSTSLFRAGATLYDLCTMAEYLSTQECGKNSIDITFKRPDPEARICVNGDISCVDPHAITPGGSYRIARIHIRSVDGVEREIEVKESGQVSVVFSGAATPTPTPTVNPSVSPEIPSPSPESTEDPNPSPTP